MVLSLRGLAVVLLFFAFSSTVDRVEAQIVHPFQGILFYTSYYNPNVSQNPAAVHYRPVSYNGSGTLTLGTTVDLVTFAAGVGADGIVLTSDGYLAVGGEGNLVHKVNPNRINTFTNVTAAGTNAFHMMEAPDGTIYSAGEPGTPASYRSDLSGGGTAHPLTGDLHSINSIAWSDSRHAFYTSSTSSGVGSFGTIDMTTFRTTQIYANLPAAHGMVFDPYTGDLILFGAKHLTQIDPVTHAIVSDLDVSGAQYPFGIAPLDQGATDGLGHLFIANNSGYMLFVDITNSLRVGAPDFVRTPFVGSQLDDIAPLIGPGGTPSYPVNDQFANASTLNGNAGRVTANNLFGSSELGEPSHASVSGGASIWYRWTAPVTENIVFTTAGSDFDTLLGVYTGGSVNSLTPIASSDNYAQGVNGSSRVQFHAIRGTTYYIAVDGAAGVTGHVVLRWLPPVNTFDVESGGGTDVLFQNSQSGQVLYWTLAGTSFVGYNFLNPSNPGPGWNVVGTGDLNNDGKPDVVFQNQQSGKLAYWTLNGPQAFNIALLGDPGTPDWKVVSLADLDGDGKPDILFQNQQSGNLVYWLMDGVNQIGSGALNPLNPGPDWKVVGAADFNGDDKVDLLFQNSQTGALVYWLMDGVNLITYGLLSPSKPGAGWNVVSLTDFNGDGKADLLFQNQSSGQLAYWLMDGIREVTIGLLTDPGTPLWRIVSSH